MLSGLVGWAVRRSHRAWWAYCKSRGIINRPSMWLSPNPTATTTSVSTHVNHRSLSTAASLCPPCPQMFLHCVSCETELSQISGVYAYTAVDTAHIGMQVQILSVWSLHLEWLETHQRRESGMVMNQSTLSHHPLLAISMITTRKSRQLHQLKRKKLTKYTQM